MAQGFLQSFDKSIEVYSAGTNPATKVSRIAVQVMTEAGIDISSHYPKHVDKFINDEWDYVITVCDNAKEICPVFPGKVRHRLHLPFEDPYDVIGTKEFKVSEYRRIRDLIKADFYNLYLNQIKQK